MQITVKCDKCDHISDTKKSLQLHNLLEHVLKNKMSNYLDQFERLHTSLLGKHKIILEQSILFKCSLCNYKTSEIKYLQDHACKNSENIYSEYKYDSMKTETVNADAQIKPENNIDEEEDPEV